MCYGENMLQTSPKSMIYVPKTFSLKQICSIPEANYCTYLWDKLY